MARKQASESKAVLSSSAAPSPIRHKTASKRATRPAAVEVTDAPGSESEVSSNSTVATITMSADEYRDAVAKLAYTYWLERGCQHGSAEADWLRAEQELSTRQ